MKVYINRLVRDVSAPWGGGGIFVRYLAQALVLRGHTLTDDPTDADTLFCVDPRPNDGRLGLDSLEAVRRARPGVKLVARLGDVGTHGKPELTHLQARVVRVADLVVSPSTWARDYISRVAGVDTSSVVVVRNGVIPGFTRTADDPTPSGDVPFVVTHHWSDNLMKGHAVYESLIDRIVTANAEGKTLMRFMYVGRTPSGPEFSMLNRSRWGVAPRTEVRRILSMASVYVTASRLEAGANHVLEAIACGLPVLCHDDGGSIPEYVSEVCPDAHVVIPFSEDPGVMASRYFERLMSLVEEGELRERRSKLAAYISRVGVRTAADAAREVVERMEML